MKIKKDNIKVNLNGKELLDYFKWEKENKKTLSVEDKRFVKVIGSIFGVLGTICLTAIIIIDQLTPSEPLNFTWEGILMFLAICVGIGWITHGVGFLLVRR